MVLVVEDVLGAGARGVPVGKVLLLAPSYRGIHRIELETPAALGRIWSQGPASPRPLSPAALLPLLSGPLLPELPEALPVGLWPVAHPRALI